MLDFFDFHRNFVRHLDLMQFFKPIFFKNEIEVNFLKRTMKEIHVHQFLEYESRIFHPPITSSSTDCLENSETRFLSRFAISQ